MTIAHANDRAAALAPLPTESGCASYSSSWQDYLQSSWSLLDLDDAQNRPWQGKAMWLSRDQQLKRTAYALSKQRMATKNLLTQ